MRQQRSFEVGPTSLREARAFVVNLIAGAGSESLEFATLMVSELATNAQLHAATEFEVVADYSAAKGPAGGGRLRVEVTDAGSGEPSLRQPHSTEPHGRGLQIVALLSDDWGIEWPRDRPGKTVWFELTVQPPRPADKGAFERRAAARAARGGDVAPPGPPVHESPSVTLSVSTHPDEAGPASSVLTYRGRSRHRRRCTLRSR